MAAEGPTLRPGSLRAGSATPVRESTHTDPTDELRLPSPPSIAESRFVTDLLFMLDGTTLRTSEHS